MHASTRELKFEFLTWNERTNVLEVLEERAYDSPALYCLSFSLFSAPSAAYMENIMNDDDTMKNSNNNAMDEPATTENRQVQTRQLAGRPLYVRIGRQQPSPLPRRLPSMTAAGLEKTMALLQPRPAHLVAQGLASRQLLEGERVPRSTTPWTSAAAASSPPAAAI